MPTDPSPGLPEAERHSLVYLVFRQALFGMGIADMDGNLIDFNDAVIKPGGYTREEVFQLKNVANLYSRPDERERALSLAKKQGYLNRFPCLFKRKDGSDYQALMTLRAIDHEGKKYWLATIEDLSGI